MIKRNIFNSLKYNMYLYICIFPSTQRVLQSESRQEATREKIGPKEWRKVGDETKEKVAPRKLGEREPG